MATFRTTRRVEFADTDAAGIMHFSGYFRLMEEAEHELLRSLGLSVLMRDELGPISWPRVRASCDYRAALRFEEVVEIAVSVARLGEKSVTYHFEFLRDGQPLASGEITAVCCRLEHGEPLRSMAIPTEIAAKLRTVAGPAE